MPTMEFFAGEDIPLDFVLIETISYMLFPKSEGHRERYVAHRYGDFLLQGATDGAIAMPTEMFEAILRDNKPKEVKTPSHSIISKGCIAGEILINLIELDAEGGETSVNRATYLAEDYFWKATNTKGNRSAVLAGEKMKSAWSQFKSVSHFWAANNIIAADPNRDDWLQSIVKDPARFLAIAMKAKEKASVIKRYDGKGTIVPENNFWVLPSDIELPNCQWECTGLRDTQKEVNRRYKASHWNPKH